MFFKRKIYSFKPSYEAKTLSKIKQLNLEFEDLFIKYINKSLLTKEEEEKLGLGIIEISSYVKSSIYFQILESFNSKTPLEKKASVLFEKLKQQYQENFKDFIEEEFYLLAEDSVFEAIGMVPSSKVFKKTEEGNIISFIKKNLFFKIVNFLDKQVNSYSNLKDTFEFIEEDFDEEFIDDLLISSNLKKSLNVDVYERLKECLIKKDIDKDLIPYVKFLAEFKPCSVT